MSFQHHVFETLREYGELVLYRGRREDDGSHLLAVEPLSEHPLVRSLEQLEHEHSIREELDPDWAAQPLALTLLVIPLILAKQLIASLTFRFTDDREFRPEELEIARALASQASLAIHLTRLAKAARQSAVLEERNQLRLLRIISTEGKMIIGSTTIPARTMTMATPWLCNRHRMM